MSEMQYHKGTLKKRFNKKISFEEGIKILQKEYKIPDEDFNIEDEYLYNNDVFWINKEFYIIENHETFDPDYIKIFTKNNGNIDFIVSFYDGGTNLKEVLESIVNNE